MVAATRTQPHGVRHSWSAARRGLGLAAVVALAAAGCHSDSGATGSTSSASSSSGVDASAQATLPPGVANAVDVPTNVPNDPSLRQQVQLTTCAKTASGWQAAGTATAAAAKAVTYTITVFFTTASATVIGFGSTRVTVRQGAPTQWSVSADFTPAPDTRCVLRGVG